MNNWTLLVILLASINLTFSQSSTYDFILKEKDLIPEGSTYNGQTEEFYVGSIYRQKIVALDKNGNEYTLVPQEVFGNLSPIGILYDSIRNILWMNVALAPIVNQSQLNTWQTGLIRYDLSNDNYAIYLYEGTKQSFFNDLTSLPDGRIIMTESANNRLYLFNPITEKISLFCQLENYTFPNGIQFHNPSKSLYVAVDQGILKIDIDTKQRTLLPTSDHITPTVIDGLSIYNNYFIGHQSKKICRFYVNDEWTEIIDQDILDTGPEFDSSTTGDIGNGEYYYIVNSQLKSAFNGRAIKPLDSLEHVIIRRRKL